MNNNRVNQISKLVKIHKCVTIDGYNYVYFSFLGKEYNYNYKVSDLPLRKLIAYDIITYGLSCFYYAY